MAMMDVDEFLVPAAALARSGLPPAVLLAPRNAAEAEAVRGAMSGLLSQSVALVRSLLPSTLNTKQPRASARRQTLPRTTITESLNHRSFNP